MTDAQADKLLADAARKVKGLDFKGAKPLYQRVASKGPDARTKAKAHLGLARIAYESNDLSAVIRHAKRGRRAGWEADLWQARAYYAQKNYGQAQQFYQRVLSRKKSHGEAKRRLQELKDK